MKMLHNFSRRGSSLVIVLSFVVLLTIVVVVFLARNESHVQSSRNSAVGSQADTFCRGAINSLIGDLKQEIADGSSIVTANGTTAAYLPVNTSGVRQNILPYPVINGCTNLTLVKESLSGQAFYSGSTYKQTGVSRASASLTTGPSLNGRSVSLARWNKPLLLPAIDYSSSLAPDSSINFSAPAWVYVARSGSNPTTYSSTLADASGTNQNFVVGRYAYAIYDEAALLDINAAGYPNNITPAQINAKGITGLADLTQLGLIQSDIDALVGWRNYASTQVTGSFPNYAFNASSATNYYNFLMGIDTGLIPSPVSSSSNIWLGARKSGFLHPANQSIFNGQTDRMFTSRQELIRLLVHDVAQNATDRARVQKALQYLGTFSRELNSPSWIPVKPELAASGTSTIDYAKNAYTQAITPASSGAPANQIASAVLVTKPFQRDDGTQAQIGEPLMKYRFPLRRLEWFNAANQNKYKDGIQKWFSMKDHGDGTWDFVDPDSSSVITGLPTIKTLDQVAAAGREPTFWEVLQAAILAGSLGDGNYYTFNNTSQISTDTSPVRHLLQIGLNIIDQYNSNTTPTVFRLGSDENTAIPETNAAGTTPVAGTKNLPYIFEWAQQGFMNSCHPSTIVNANNINPNGNGYYLNTFSVYLQFLLWNPHSNFTEAPSSGNFKLLVSGSFQCIPTANTSDTVNNDPSYPRGTAVGYPYSAPLSISFTASKDRFGTIDLLTPDDCDSNLNGNAKFPLNASNPYQVGAFCGSVDMSLYPGTESAAVSTYNKKYYVQSGQVQTPACTVYVPPTFRLEVRDAAGHWLPYQVIPNIEEEPSFPNWSPGYYTLSKYMNTRATAHSGFYTGLISVRSDPRTIRFGSYLCGGSKNQPNNWNLTNTSGSATLETVGVKKSTVFQNPTIIGASSSYYPATMAFNIPSVGQFYPSVMNNSMGNLVSTLDGITRRADGNASLTFANGSPYFNAATPSGTTGPARPYFLGRSFNSVAEMGYAFRDEPWKSLNFYSADSADGALLDFFSISEGSLRASSINVNTASTPVLQAMLSGACTDTADSGSKLTSDQAAAIATAMRTYLGNTRSATPNAVLYDPSDIPTLSGTVTMGANNPVPNSTNLPGGLKRAQEVIVRSFADTWNTRTWNLMIDVIAQTGRFPKTGANGLDQFVVDGERRVWAHVAIDRFSGKVIDFQIEPVTE